MVIRIRLAAPDLPVVQGNAVSGAVIWVRRLPLLFKVANILFLSMIPLTASVLIVSRMNVPSKIYTPPQAYLPGNPLPRFAGKDSCDKFAPINMVCNGPVFGQKIYWYYELGTRRIVRTGISASEYTIGDLILAWGTPTGFDQYGTSIIVSWGARSALLVTNSFQPYSRVRFIEYDLEPYRRSRWRGFVGRKSDDLSE